MWFLWTIFLAIGSMALEEEVLEIRDASPSYPEIRQRTSACYPGRCLCEPKSSKTKERRSDNCALITKLIEDCENCSILVQLASFCLNICFKPSDDQAEEI